MLGNETDPNYVTSMYEHVTTNPTLTYNYNAPILKSNMLDKRMTVESLKAGA